jgi:hypothetical protein
MEYKGYQIQVRDYFDPSSGEVHWEARAVDENGDEVGRIFPTASVTRQSAIEALKQRIDSFERGDWTWRDA